MEDMRSILVVDDEADMRLAIKEALVRKGYSVELASDGTEALEKLKSREYAMVISTARSSGPLRRSRRVRKTLY
jgi:CheY-like chemotaxis protein